MSYMMRGMGNMQGMMKQMQKLQKEMASAQEALHQQTFTGSANNDLVKVTFTGDKTMQSIDIDSTLLNVEHKEVLEDVILLAVNDALNRIDEATEKTLGKYTQGLGIPGL